MSSVNPNKGLILTCRLCLHEADNLSLIRCWESLFSQQDVVNLTKIWLSCAEPGSYKSLLSAVTICLLPSMVAFMMSALEIKITLTAAPLHTHTHIFCGYLYVTYNSFSVIPTFHNFLQNTIITPFISSLAQVFQEGSEETTLFFLLLRNYVSAQLSKDVLIPLNCPWVWVCVNGVCSLQMDWQPLWSVFLPLAWWSLG